jgi:hypothetical protein
VHAWIQALIIQRIVAGGMKEVSSSIQARIHSVLTTAMLGYEQCKCAHTPRFVSFVQPVCCVLVQVQVVTGGHAVEPARLRLHCRRSFVPLYKGASNAQNIREPHQLEPLTALDGCRKLNESPFPFPWAQSITIILAIFVTTLPFLVAAYVNSLYVAVLTTFFTVQTYIMLNEVARDIEDPFLYDPNQLPLPQMQYKLNERLIAVSKAERPVSFTDISAIEAPTNTPPSALRHRRVRSTPSAMPSSPRHCPAIPATVLCP